MYEATVSGRGSVGARSPKSSRTGGRRHGEHGAKVTRLTLGDLLTCQQWLISSRDAVTGGQKSAEGIVDRRSGRRPERANLNRCQGLDD